MNDADLEAHRVVDRHSANVIGEHGRRCDAQGARVRREARIDHYSVNHAKLNANAVAAQRVRALLRRVRSVERTSIARMFEVFQHRRAKRRHARFPLRTATSSARIDSATSGGLFPPMSRPIGV